MKNQREIYEALLAGETLTHAEGIKAKLDNNGYVTQIPQSFLFPEQWQIYKEPKWYENIPDGGVLCWVKDGEGKEFNKYPEMVINYCDDSTHFFETPNESWMYADPLTKTQIQMFMENAPDEF